MINTEPFRKLRGLRLVAAFVLGLASLSAADFKDLAYGVAGGERLLLDASVPDGPGPFPVVILIHGGGWSAGDKRANGIAPAFAPLTQAGIAWFSINYRLAPKHPFPACVEDVETAIRWVKAHAKDYHIDPQRLGLAGFSAGGHLAALVGTRGGPGLDVQAVATFAGVLDLESYAQRSPKIAEVFGPAVSAAALPAALRALSPTTHLRPGLPPFLLIHGTVDPLVLPAQSENFAAQLRALGISHELVLVEKGAHSLPGWIELGSDFRARFAAWMTRTLAK